MERDNRQVWDGARRGHYEVWYLTLNHQASRTGYWIRYTMESPRDGHGAPYAQLWFAHFAADDPSRTFAINRRFPIEEMSTGADPFAVAIADAVLTDGSALGALAGGDHEVAWDLRWTPSPTTHRQLPDVFYRRGGLGDTTVLTPNLNVQLHGTITVDGTTHALAGDPGGQTHLWGRKHAFHWAWGHCNAFEGNDSAALETLTVRLKRRGRVLPPLTICGLHLDGEELLFNQLRHTAINRGTMGTAFYRFSGQGARARIEGEYSCRPEDMVVAEYADPDGEPSWCSNTEVADLRVTVWERAGLLGRWRERARLLAPRRGHFEVGARERDPAVKKDHQPI